VARQNFLRNQALSKGVTGIILSVQALLPHHPSPLAGQVHAA
jgi:hypothetical protein